MTLLLCAFKLTLMNEQPACAPIMNIRRSKRFLNLEASHTECALVSSRLLEKVICGASEGRVLKISHLSIGNFTEIGPVCRFLGLRPWWLHSETNLACSVCVQVCVSFVASNGRLFYRLSTFGRLTPFLLPVQNVCLGYVGH